MKVSQDWIYLRIPITPSQFKKTGRLKDRKCYYSQAGSSTYMQKAQPSKGRKFRITLQKDHLKQRDEFAFDS